MPLRLMSISRLLFQNNPEDHLKAVICAAVPSVCFFCSSDAASESATPIRIVTSTTVTNHVASECCDSFLVSSVGSSWRHGGAYTFGPLPACHFMTATPLCRADSHGFVLSLFTTFIFVTKSEQ